MENDFVPLVTERLSLRPLCADDAAALHRLVNDWEVAKTLARVPFPYPRDLADEWIASTRAQIAASTAWHLAVTRDEDGAEALLGCVGLTLDAKNPREAELGYWIGRRHWGQGLGRSPI
jgi:8-oxo-dGTP diphosphatase